MLNVNSVFKSYGNVDAVKDITFQAQPGKILGLIGPNGAGKSTTIKMIMNIIAPDKGNISFGGNEKRQENVNRIGYLPEERGLYKKEKVNDVLLYFSSLKDCPKSEAQKNIDTWLSTFGLSEWKHRKVEELSKGMAQKVQFIATVAHDPDYLFFDEPFSGLDPGSADTLLKAIQKLAAQGKTILFSTHIMENAERICHDIFLINHGKQLLYGPMAEIKKQYGKNSIGIEYDGDGSFIKDMDEVKTVREYPRYVEIELNDSIRKNDFLIKLTQKLEIHKYEIMTPSLHKIFLDLTTAKGETHE